MRKSLFNTILTGAVVLLLITACAEDKKDVQENKAAASTAAVNTSKTKASTPRTISNGSYQSNSIMDKPVNFSTTEDVEYTLLTIRDKEGDKAYKKIKSAMGYIMTYDLSVGRNEARMHKKLNGKTPNEIIAMMKR